MRTLFILFFCAFQLRLLATPAPDFTITTSDGVVRQLYADYISQNKLVVIKAFFTTCPPCNAHSPHFQALYDAKGAEYPGQFEFLMLSTQAFDLNTYVAQYRSSKGLTMPGAGADGGSQTALQPYLSGQYGVFLGTPTYIVIAPGTGEVHFDVRGGSAANTMTLIGNLMDALLAPPPTLKIYASAVTPCGDPIENVTYEVRYGDEVETLASPDGFLDYDMGAETLHRVRPSSPSGNPLGAFSTYDIVLIQRHILGQDTFKSVWPVRAADVNNSGTVTTFDIVLMRRVILGIDDALPGGPFLAFYPEYDSTATGKDMLFKGLRKGGVSLALPCDDAAPPADDRAPLRLWTDDRIAEPGVWHTLAFGADEALRLEGLQGAMVPGAGVEIGGMESESLEAWSDAHFFVDEKTGVLRFSWNGTSSAHVDAGQPLWVVRARSQRAAPWSELLRLDDAGLKAEVYEPFGAPRGMWLGFRGAPLPSGPLSWSLLANPGVPGRIGLRVVAPEDVRTFPFTLCNAAGQTLRSIAPTLHAGEQFLWIDTSGLSTGLYYLNGRAVIIP